LETEPHVHMYGSSMVFKTRVQDIQITDGC